MEKLPRGKHKLPREFVVQNQRERMLAAVVACVHEDGYAKTTVGKISVRARVSKADFYKHFDSKDEAFLAAYDEGVESIHAAVEQACAQGGEWSSRVCAGLSALLSHMASEPGETNLVLVEGLSGGREFQDRFQAGVRSFVPYLRDGAPRGQRGAQPPETADEAIVGGIASLLSRHVLAGEGERLEEFFPEIAEFALAPYVGSEEARRIISAA